jgi:hypothetical protein
MLKRIKSRHVLRAVALVLFALTILPAGYAGQSSDPNKNSKTAKQSTLAKDSMFTNYTFTSQEKLIKDTNFLRAILKYNPHDNHFGQLPCTKCHNSAKDGSSQVWCTSCHIGFKVPKGWSAYPDLK